MSQFDISGSDVIAWHPPNIILISFALLTSHFEISGNSLISGNVNIDLKFSTLLTFHLEMSGKTSNFDNINIPANVFAFFKFHFEISGKFFLHNLNI